MGGQHRWVSAYLAACHHTFYNIHCIFVWLIERIGNCCCWPTAFVYLLTIYSPTHRTAASMVMVCLCSDFWNISGKSFVSIIQNFGHYELYASAIEKLLWTVVNLLVGAQALFPAERRTPSATRSFCWGDHNKTGCNVCWMLPCALSVTPENSTAVCYESCIPSCIG